RVAGLASGSGDRVVLTFHRDLVAGAHILEAEGRGVGGDQLDVFVFNPPELATALDAGAPADLGDNTLSPEGHEVTQAVDLVHADDVHPVADLVFRHVYSSQRA